MALWALRKALSESIPDLSEHRNGKFRFPVSFIFNALQASQMVVLPYTTGTSDAARGSLKNRGRDFFVSLMVVVPALTRCSRLELDFAPFRKYTSLHSQVL